MNENEKMELRDEQLEQVSGGAINVYDAGAYHTEYWKYTCPACGISAVTNYWPEHCTRAKERILPAKGIILD